MSQEKNLGKNTSIGKERIIVALDVASRNEALHLVSLLPQARFFKIGLRLFITEGPPLVREIIAQGKEVFLDLKLHDIPNTVAQAVEEAVRLGVNMLTLHVAGGKEMLKRAVEVVKAGKKGPEKKPLLLGVTVLTSLSGEDLKEIGFELTPSQLVLKLTRSAMNYGLDGLVCSAQEVQDVAQLTKGRMILVTPGIRPTWAAANDQKRITTPRQAIEGGADFMVIGRPIIAADHPEEAFAKIVEEIQEAIS
ncbi:MAG TPA: orotidine-5'-phosphate decarboxylase [Candidatus Aminicenantes bacterium]|nr:orotidine-5'-phosphate decarboxylase [Candidatus Aminicenantes bacterium]